MMENLLHLHKRPPLLEWSFQTATKTNCEKPPAKELKNTPTMGSPAKAEDIHIKTSKSSLNSHLVMRELLTIDKT